MQVIIRHVFTEANYCADKLANMGANSDLGVHWLTALSLDLFPLLQADLLGIVLPCLCNFQQFYFVL